MNEQWRNLLQKLKKPTGWLLALTYIVTAISIAGALTLVVIMPETLGLQILSYIFYGLAAISLGYTVYTIVLFAPRMKANITSWMRKSKLVSRMLDNYGFRTVLLAAGSLLLNIAYSVFNGVIGILERSVWYGALAGYYILLTLLRSGIVLYHRKKAKGLTRFDDETEERFAEIKKFKVCGALLIALPFFLSFAILEMVVNDKGYGYMGIMIYVVAAYTFYKITMAIVNAVRARKKSDDLTIQALRNIGLADALVSILALQTAMFHSFGTELTNTGLANALTGGGVCALTIALGVFTLIVANRKTKELQKEINYAGKSE
ncbi:MAG: hypothetical protein IJ506_08090 [Clostridia bacterium]|nr:hypothetical protein [Clostridia bacterium]